MVNLLKCWAVILKSVDQIFSGKAFSSPTLKTLLFLMFATNNDSVAFLQ